MSFPLQAQSNSGSLLFNLALGFERSSVAKSPELILRISGDLCRLLDMHPGNLNELDRAVCVMTKSALTVEDQKARHYFAQQFIDSQAASKTKFQNLDDCLSNIASKDFPPYCELMETINALFFHTDLRGYTEDWGRILKRHYSEELEKDARILLRELCHRLKENQYNVQSPCEEEQYDRKVNHFGKEQLQWMNQVLGCGLQQRLEAVLKPTATSGELSAQQLHIACNALLRENYMLGKLAQLFNTLQSELEIKPGQIAKKLRLMDKNAKCAEKCLSSVSFFLITEAQLDRVNASRKPPPKKLSGNRGLLASIQQSDFFSRFDPMVKFIDEVEKYYRGKPDELQMSKSAQKRRDLITVYKCRWHCENALYYIGDAHLKTGRSWNTLPPEEEREIAPLSTAFVNFFEKVINPITKEFNIFEVLEFLAKLTSIGLDNQKKQGIVYKKALHKLNQLIGEQKGHGKREFLKFKKIDIDLPGFGLALPDEISFHTMDLADRCDLKQDQSKSPNGAKDKKHLKPSNEMLKSDFQKSVSASALDQAQVGVSKVEHVSPPQPTLQQNRAQVASPLDLPHAAPFPFTYDKRVTRWFATSAPLNPLLFSEYQGLSYRYQTKMIDLHAFSQLADYFCQQSFLFTPSSSACNETKCHILPAEMMRDDEQERGYILWAVDKKQCCYHRFFHIDESPTYYDKLIRKAFNDADFPELSQAQQNRSQKIAERLPSRIDATCDVKIEFDDLLQIVSIHQLKTSNCLKIFIGRSQLEDE